MQFSKQKNTSCFDNELEVVKHTKADSYKHVDAIVPNDLKGNKQMDLIRSATKSFGIDDQIAYNFTRGVTFCT